ncbi:hypothetical protein VaNZ11_013420 [Volvox africanus]|uniref:Kinesin motor domain-containing protein n=1 Tax=Volvox africanus TaxID=51714 RepID=A0ABQ5SGU2_9CHLO|nr:hypothetical protein VaNZ11_013420 [Volvox africanus]
MKNTFKTPARLFTGRGMLEAENSEANVTTPKGTVKTPHSGIHFSQLRQTLTCLKPRSLVINETSTTIKRRFSPRHSDSVKVFVRVKPVLEDDLRQGRTKEALEVCEKDGKRGIVLPAANSKENWFSHFDGVLDDATNQEVFDAIGGDLLRQFLSGINVSIMAYGQTGSGKTYTMFGSKEPDAQVQGLLHLVLNRIEEQICLRTHLTRLSVAVFEVYNDELFSLLDAGGVERKPMNRGVVEYGQHRPKQIDDVSKLLGLVLEALDLRARDATVRNATSSRSHAFVKLRLEQMAALPDDSGVDSTLFLVDLAGSESMSNASSSTQQNETIYINKSLQALERVVNSLSNSSIHVPYRDSLLTQVLQEGLNPQKARVALVTTVSRFLTDVHVTKSTLMFAQRARNIRTFAQVNMAAKRPPQLCPEEIYGQLQNMQAINNKLRQQLADLESSQGRLQGRSQHVEAMREELARLSELHSELQRTSARQQNEAEAALELERGAHTSTRLQLAELQQCNAELQEAAAAAEAEARAVARSTADLKCRLHECQLQVVRLNGELAGAQSLAEQVQMQHRAAEQQLVQAREQLTVLKGQLAAAQDIEVTTYQTSIRQLQQQLQEANADAVGLAQELALTKQQLEQLQLRIMDSQTAAAGVLQQQQQEKQQQQDDVPEGDRLELVLQEGLTDEEVEAGEERADAAEGAEADLQWESSDGAIALVHELEATQAQLEARTSKLAEVEKQLAAAREQLIQIAIGEKELVEARSEGAALRQQLTEARAAAAAAAQEARIVAEATAAARFVPLQTECERLRAMCSLSEQQLGRLQAECERLRVEGGESRESMLRLQAECERLREAAARAESEASERQARLEALQAERDTGPRVDGMKQLQERVRMLEIEKKRSETDHKGQLELKDKLIHQLENMTEQLQSEVTKLRHEASGAVAAAVQLGDSLGLASGPGGAGSSPFSGQHLQLHQSASRSEPGASPGTVPEDSSCSALSSSAPPSRAPSGGGILLLNRTTTGSAAALARTNSRATGSVLASALSTPPPVPRFIPPQPPSPVTLPSSASKATLSATPAKSQVLGPDSSADATVIDLTGEPNGGPPEPKLTPSSCPPLDDGLVLVMRGQHHSDELKLATNAFRNQMNY